MKVGDLVQLSSYGLKVAKFTFVLPMNDPLLKDTKGLVVHETDVNGDLKVNWFLDKAVFEKLKDSGKLNVASSYNYERASYDLDRRLLERRTLKFARKS